MSKLTYKELKSAAKMLGIKTGGKSQAILAKLIDKRISDMNNGVELVTETTATPSTGDSIDNRVDAGSTESNQTSGKFLGYHPISGRKMYSE